MSIEHTVTVIVYERKKEWPHDFEVSVCFKKDELNSFVTEGRIACFEHTFIEGEGLDGP